MENANKSFFKRANILKKQSKSNILSFYHLLLCATVLLLSPKFLLAQQTIINLDVQEEKRASVLLDLAVEYDYEIVFNAAYFKEEKITLSIRNETIREALKQILAGTRIDFKIEDRAIQLIKKKRLYGYIIDQQTGEKLINAAFYDPISGKGQYTNDYGFFSVDLPFETTEGIASYIGYESQHLPLNLQDEQALSIELKPVLNLNEVVVFKDEQSQALKVSTNGDELLSNEIKSHFATGGEADIFQYLYQKPGVTKGPDGLGGLHVRGGNSDQNLILYDGVKVYNPNHSLGLFSIFNSNLLKHARFSKYNFNPRFGGNLSSVLDLRLKEGSLRNWGGNVSLSTLATQVTLDGPLVNDKTGLMVAVRRTHLDPYIKNRTESNKAEFDELGYSNHYFYDVNAKLHHRFGLNDRLFLSFYQGKDAYYDETDYLYEDEELYVDYLGDYDMKWGNRLLSLRWNHLFGNKMFANLTASYSNFNYNSVTYSRYISVDDLFGTFEYQEILTSFLSDISEVGVDYDVDYFPIENHHLLFGGGFHRVTYEPGVVSLRADDVADLGIEDEYYENVFEQEVDNAYRSNAFHLYANDTWNLTEQSKIQAGIRYTLFQSEDFANNRRKVYHLFQSRLSYQYQLNRATAIALSYGRSWQPLHLLTSGADVGFPNDLWVPSTAFVRPQLADQVNLNLTYADGKYWSINGSIYYKQMKNLLRYESGGTLPSLYENASKTWQNEVVSGTGTAKGFELDVQYKSEGLKTNLSYTLSKTDRQFPDFNQNEAFPFQFDQRHSLALNVYQALKENIWIYVNWQLTNGLKQTLYKTDAPYQPLETFSTPPEDQLSDENDYNLPIYHRLDLGLICTLKTNKLDHEFVLGVQNVYNQRNIYFAYQYQNEYFPEDDELVERKSLALLPTLRYKLSFGH